MLQCNPDSWLSFYSSCAVAFRFMWDIGFAVKREIYYFQQIMFHIHVGLETGVCICLISDIGDTLHGKFTAGMETFMNDTGYMAHFIILFLFRASLVILTILGRFLVIGTSCTLFIYTSEVCIRLSARLFFIIYHEKTYTSPLCYLFLHSILIKIL